MTVALAATLYFVDAVMCIARTIVASQTPPRGCSTTRLCLVAIHHCASSGCLLTEALFLSLADAGVATILLAVHSLHFQLFSHHMRGEAARRS